MTICDGCNETILESKYSCYRCGLNKDFCIACFNRDINLCLKHSACNECTRQIVDISSQCDRCASTKIFHGDCLSNGLCKEHSPKCLNCSDTTFKCKIVYCNECSECMHKNCAIAIRCYKIHSMQYFCNTHITKLTCVKCQIAPLNKDVMYDCYMCDESYLHSKCIKNRKYSKGYVVLCPIHVQKVDADNKTRKIIKRYNCKFWKDVGFKIVYTEPRGYNGILEYPMMDTLGHIKFTTSPIYENDNKDNNVIALKHSISGIYSKHYKKRTFSAPILNHENSVNDVKQCLRRSLISKKASFTNEYRQKVITYSQYKKLLAAINKTISLLNSASINSRK